MDSPVDTAPPVLSTVTWRGLPIVIENLAGSYREWTDLDGKTGRTAMQWPYGYFADHLGADGDELDCYVGPQAEAPFVYVVHQLATPEYKAFDEDKVFLDFASEQAAKAVFLQHRSDGDRAYGGMSVIPVERFLSKLKARSGSGKIRHSRGVTMPVRSFHGITGSDLRGYAGRVVAFDALDAGGKVRVGVWDRFATFGEGAEGIKVKEGEAVSFTPDTFAKMIDNWAARGQQLTMCLDHRSALGGLVEAPAAALYDAIAVVGEDGKTVHMKTVYGKTIPEPDAATLLEQCAKYPPRLSQPGGMWGYRSEITPKGAHPTEGLANFRGISPLFVMNGVDEQERPIGPVLFDVAAVNVNFQGGCELTLGALSAAGMSAAESALHVPGPVGEKKPEENMTFDYNPGDPWQKRRDEAEWKLREADAAVSIAKSSPDRDKARKAVDYWQGVIRVLESIPADHRMSAPAAPGATAMASASDLNVGDRLRNAKTGNAGTITEKKPDGSAHVKWEGADGDGWFYPGAPLPPEISRMSTTLGASSAVEGAKKMNPETMKRMGFADGANPSVEEKMAAYAKCAMGDATPEEIKAMAADLEASGDEKAKAMAKKMGDLVLTHKDDDAPAAMAAAEPAATAAMAAQMSALAAANGALASKLAALEADKAARDARAKAEQEQKFSALADEAVKGGYPADARDALIARARLDFAAAQKLVAPLVQQDPTLFARTQMGATGPANTPGVKRTGNVVRYGMDLSEAIKRIQKEEKVSFERAAALASERHPEMLRNYEAHQAN